MDNKKSKSRRIYLDNAAATPLRAEVLDAMIPYLANNFGNANSIHQEGVLARRAIDAARSLVARVLEIKTTGVIFTGSGTESNNLAIIGRIKYLRAEGIAYEDMEIITTKIEHPSILEAVGELEKLGVVVRYVEVNSEGIITVSALAAVLSEKTVLVTFAYANSEVGTIQPVSRLVRSIRRFEKNLTHAIIVHLDAAQAPLWLSCAFKRLGVDVMSLDSGKCHGPKGVGILAFPKAIGLLPILFGGGQEGGLRSGTENVAGIVGAAKSLEMAQMDFEKRGAQVEKIRDEAILLLKEKIPNAVINGSAGPNRLPNNINFSIPNIDTEFAVIYLDTNGVAASTKSACAGAGGGESVVVKVITSDAARSRATIRFSLGEDTTTEEMKSATDILAQYCEKMSNFDSVY